MTLAQARRRIWAFRALATIFVLVAGLKVVMSAVKSLYFVAADSSSLAVVAALIARQYESVVAGSFLLELCWRTAPLLDPGEFAFMQYLYFAVPFGFILSAALMWNHASKLAAMRANAKRRRQEREWEEFPDG